MSRDSQFSPPSERTASDPLLETLEARDTVDLVLDVMFRYERELNKMGVQQCQMVIYS